MGLLYRKTAKGVSEVATRASGLTPRLRHALILVDGRRADQELRALLATDADHTLATLLEQGLIELVGSLRSAPAGAGAAPAPAPTPRARPDWQEQRRQAVRFLNDQLGPTAESLVLKIERCRDPAELAPSLEVAEAFLRSARGASVANEFATKFLQAPTG